MSIDSDIVLGVKLPFFDLNILKNIILYEPEFEAKLLDHVYHNCPRELYDKIFKHLNSTEAEYCDDSTEKEETYYDFVKRIEEDNCQTRKYLDSVLLWLSAYPELTIKYPYPPCNAGCCRDKYYLTYKLKAMDVNELNNFIDNIDIDRFCRVYNILTNTTDNVALELLAIPKIYY